MYKHYNITLQRNPETHDQPRELFFVFHCIKHPEKHKPYLRARLNTKEGTSNLYKALEKCEAVERRGLVAPGVEPPVQFSDAAFRARQALRSAKNNRPFNMVTDEDYIAEVQMLRPGTHIPSPATISRDINSLYLAMSIMVRNYFAVWNIYAEF